VKLIILTLSLLSIAIFTISVLNFYSSRKMMQERILEDLYALVETKAERITSIIEQDFERVSLIASRTRLRECFLVVEAGEPDADACLKKMKKILIDARNSVPSIREVSVLDLEGNVISTTSGKDVEGIQPGPQVKAYVSEYHLSDLYIKNGYLMCSAYAPMFHPEGGEPHIIGSVKADIKVTRLLDILSDYTGLGETGEMVLGKKLNSSVIVLNNLRHKGDTALKLKIPFSPGTEDPLRLATGGLDGIIRARDYRNIDVLAAYKYIPITGWGFVVKIDAEEAFRPIVVLEKKIILVSLIVLLFSVVVMSFFARLITNPIRRLHEGTELIAAGNLDSRLDISTRDEIGQLARTFNEMAEKLSELYSGLEDKVRTRTLELKITQDRLRITEKFAAIGRLAGAVAHNLRTPLSIAKNAVYLLTMRLREDKIENKDINLQLERIGKEVAACDRIIESILTFSRSRRLEERLEDIDLGGLIKKVLNEADVPENIKVSFQKKGDINMLGDPEQIKLVYRNLINNAIEAMPDGGNLTITAETEDNHIRSEVIDTGKGISPEQIHMIFDPLFSTKPGERGLGLMATQSIVEAYNGSIEIESEPEEGTRAKLRFSLK